MVSPGRNWGTSVRLFFWIYFVNNAFCMTISLIFYLISARQAIRRLCQIGLGAAAVPRLLAPNQVRPQPRRLFLGCPAPEPADLLVMSAQQDLRSLPAAKLSRTRPV